MHTMAKQTTEDHTSTATHHTGPVSMNQKLSTSKTTHPPLLCHQHSSDHDSSQPHAVTVSCCSNTTQALACQSPAVDTSSGNARQQVQPAVNLLQRLHTSSPSTLAAKASSTANQKLPTSPSQLHVPTSSEQLQQRPHRQQSGRLALSTW